jgi:hypothetical protein
MSAQVGGTINWEAGEFRIMPSARIRASAGGGRWLSRLLDRLQARNGTRRFRYLWASRRVPLRQAPKTLSISGRL